MTMVTKIRDFFRSAVRPIGLRSRRLLVLATLASVFVHLALTQWPVPPSDEPEPMPPLTATITELPPPPAPVQQRAPPKRKHRLPVAAVPIAPVPVSPETVAEAAVERAESPAPAQAAAEAPLEEPVANAAPEPPKPPHGPLPPRIDLAYRAFLGTRGFFIGEAVYRLEHEGGQYKISTVAEARGLAALLFHGQARAQSEGAITPTGLQPNSYSIERTNNFRRESTTFDWETGMVLLNDDKSAPLESPIYDPLVVLWQFYFVPPGQDETEFNIATTRKVYHYSFRRVGIETVTLPFGDVEAEVWRRQSGDGSIDAQVWLAPSLHFVAVKVRLSNNRATVEALLDSIRVDETVAQQ